MGSTMAGRLVDHNRIVVYDNLTRNSLKDKPFKNHRNLELVVGDVLDFAHVCQAMQGADIVVHCAAIAGVDTMIYYPVPLHLQGLYASLGYGENRLPASEAASQEVLSLPMYPELTEVQQVAVAEAMREFYGG